MTRRGGRPTLKQGQDSQPVPSPVLGSGQKSGKGRSFSFSFRFWQQNKYFGIGGCDIGWLAALLDQLRDLSKEEIDLVRSDPRKKKTLRFHPVDWSAKNIPIKREHLLGIPPYFLDNSAEFIFEQITISQAEGRIIGFEDDHHVFNIVLLDPLHNLQPCKRLGHKVRECKVAQTPFDALNRTMEILKKKKCDNPNCGYARHLESVCVVRPNENDKEGKTVRHFIDAEEADRAEALIGREVVDSYTEIFQEGLKKLEQDC